MNDTEVKKWFALSVILLFLGITIVPTINYTTVKASNDNDPVEVTSQACGVKGYGNTTVKLTRQQYQNLEQYLIDFRARLNKTTTRGEAVPIFKEAVVELNKYGLLPKGMSVERAQKLVIGFAQNSRLMQRIEQQLKTSSLQEGNQLCLICGDSIRATAFQGLVNTIFYNFYYRLFDFFCSRSSFILNYFGGLFAFFIITATGNTAWSEATA
jgi:hypothetical protein